MKEAQMISDFVRRKTTMLGNGSQSSKAMLARLRRCVGKDIRDSQESWDITLGDLPTELTGRAASDDFRPSPAEVAIHTALTMFAVHMQGRDHTADSIGSSFASAVRSMMNDSNADGLKRRFDAMVTASDLTEMAYHARGLVQMMRAYDGIGFDYARFAQDIYYFQFPNGRRNVLMSWGQDFYTKQLENTTEE